MYEERVRNARRATWLRAVIVSAFFINTLVMIFIVGVWPWTPSTVVFTVYFVLALALLAIARRSENAAVAATYAIPFLDIPMVFTLQVLALPYQEPAELQASGVALQSILLLLVLFSVLTLHRWVVTTAATVALALLITFAFVSGSASDWYTFYVLLTVSFALIALYALQRLEALVTSTAYEHARRDRLRRYFSPRVANLLEEGVGEIKDATRIITVLFSDIRGFTAMSQAMAPEEVVAMLNEYYDVMVQAIFETGGTLDKFMGDGIMAYFNAPLDQPDHATRALRCAETMMRALDELNARRRRRGEEPLHMGVGIHTGPATLGSIGSPRRRDYTAVGETVNLAAHLEKLTRDTNGGVLITESTYALAEEAAVVRPIEGLSLQGIDRPVSLYTLESLNQN